MINEEIIKSVSKPNKEERELLSSYRKGEKFYYTFYFRLINSVKELNQILINTRAMENKYDILKAFFVDSDLDISGKMVKYKYNSSAIKIIDFTEKTSQETSDIIRKFCIAERKNYYIPSIKSLYYLQLVKLSNEVTLCILSICDALESIFHIKNLSANILGSNLSIISLLERNSLNKASTSESVHFLKEVLKDIKQYSINNKKFRNSISSKYIGNQHDNNTYSKNLNVNNLNDNNLNDNNLNTNYINNNNINNNNSFANIISEDFPIDEETCQLLKKINNSSKTSVEAVCISSWGLLLCNSCHQNSVYMGYFRPDSLLQLYPIRVDFSENFINIVDNMQEQLDNSLIYDNCQLSKLESYLNFKISKEFFMLHNFTVDQLGNNEDTGLDVNTIYSLASNKIYNIPLMIAYHFNNSKPYISYDYDENIFENSNIEDIHKLFLNYLKKLIKFPDIPIKLDLSFEAKTHSNQERIYKIIEEQLKKNSLFYLMDSNKRNQIVKIANIIKFDENEIIIDKDSIIEQLYIIIKGEVTVISYPDITDTDIINIANSLDNIPAKEFLKLKSGDIFGFEAFFNDNLSQRVYVATNSETFIININYNVLKKNNINLENTLIRQLINDFK